MVSKGCLKVSRGENNNKSVGMPITFTVARAYINGAGVVDRWGINDNESMHCLSVSLGF